MSCNGTTAAIACGYPNICLGLTFHTFNAFPKQSLACREHIYVTVTAGNPSSYVPMRKDNNAHALQLEQYRSKAGAVVWIRAFMNDDTRENSVFAVVCLMHVHMKQCMRCSRMACK